MLDVYERLEKAFERGRKGRVESFDIWLRECGYDPLRLQHPQIVSFFVEDVRNTVDRTEELEAIAEYLGYFAKTKSNIFHLAVVGVAGSGRTHLVSAVKKFAEKQELFKSLVLDAEKFSQQSVDEQVFFEILDQIVAEKPNLIFIDSCERDKNIAYSISEILRRIKSGVIVTCWQPVYWNYMREKIEDSIPTSREIALKQFSAEETTQLLSKIVLFASKGKLTLEEDVGKKIHDYTLGIPGSSIRLLVRSLHEAFLQQKSTVDIESVDRAAKGIGIVGASKFLENLSEVQTVILRHLLLRSDPRGVRPSELVEVLNRDKATVSYYLSNFTAERILTCERFGRLAFYRIKDEVEPLVQLRLAQESEYLG